MLKIENLDVNIIKNLIDYSNSIASLYNELYLLELNNKKNSDTYEEYIQYIFIMKKKEQETYNSIPDNLLDEYLKYFEDMNSLSIETKADVSKVLFSKNKAYITTRIINILAHIYEEREILEDDELDFYDDFGIEDMSLFLNDSIEEVNKIDKFHDEALNISTFFLDELASELNDSDLKNELLKSKYINSFANPSIETSYLSHSFDLTLYMFNNEAYKDLSVILDTAYSCSVTQIKNLLKIGTSDKKDFILNLSLLKAYLSFLSDEKIVSLINKLYAKKNKNTNSDKVKTKIINEMKKVLKSISCE